MTPRLQAAVVDLDGTMVDTAGDIEIAINRMLAELRLPQIGREFISLTVGKGTPYLIEATLTAIGADAALAEEARQRYQRHYESVNGDYSVVYPGVVEGLERLIGARVPLACLTNKPDPLARQLLAVKGLDRYFDRIFGGGAFARLKPDPLPLIETCKALGSLPGRTLMIGDSSNDAAAARSAGLPVVLMTYGYNHGEPIRDVPALQYLDRLDELVL